MLDPKTAARAALRYLQKNPDVVVHAAVNAAGLKLTVPLDLLRFLVSSRTGRKGAPRDVVFAARRPALRAEATLSLMNTTVRAGGAVRVTDVVIGPSTLRLTVTLSELSLEPRGASDSPLAALLKSGALDLSKPGNLVRYMPNRPAAVLEAEGDRVVLDLMAVPAVAKNRRLRAALAVLAPVLAVRSVSAEGDALVVGLRPMPAGLVAALRAVRSAG